MIVSFSGNDGSGKTTLGKALIKVLKDKKIRIEYRHEYDYVFIKHIFKLIGQKRVTKERQKYLIDQKEDPSKYSGQKLTVAQKLWPYIVWADNLFTVLYYKIFYRNRVIFLDRYPYDMYLSFQYMGRANWLIRKLFLSIPKADVQMIFYANPATAMERKKADHEYPLDFYVTQLKRYKEIARLKKIETHNTEEPLEETIRFILDRIKEKAPEWLRYELSRN